MQKMHSSDGTRCHLCGSTNTKVVLRVKRAGKSYTVISCSDCDVLQTAEQYESVSPDYQNISLEEVNEERVWRQGKHKYPAFQEWLTQVKQLVKDGNRPLRLLDIGCGTGGFLRYAQNHGFDVFGFDASGAQAQYAQKYLPNVRKALCPSEYLEVLGAPHLQFDIVTMWDVFEHVRKPLQILSAIQHIIMPDGLLFISVPNGRAMQWKKYVLRLLHRWSDSDWAPWEHVYYFSIPSLINYLNNMQFSTVKTGAVAAYPRHMSAFELVRRIGFSIMKYIPTLAPQIYVWARVRASSNTKYSV